MSNDRRLLVPGGTYFFTVRLQDQASDLLVSHIELLRDAMRLCRKRWPFEIEAAVVLPSKAHMIWTLPEGDADFSKRWRMIKSTFSRHAPHPDYVSPNQAKRGDKSIWQRVLWEHLIRDADDLAVHMHLIRSAPIHAGLVQRASDWPFTSLHHQMQRNAPKTIARVPSTLNPKAVGIASQMARTAANETYQ